MKWYKYSRDLILNKPNFISEPMRRSIGYDLVYQILVWLGHHTDLQWSPNATLTETLVDDLLLDLYKAGNTTGCKRIIKIRSVIIVPVIGCGNTE